MAKYDDESVYGTLFEMIRKLPQDDQDYLMDNAFDGTFLDDIKDNPKKAYDKLDAIVKKIEDGGTDKVSELLEPYKDKLYMMKNMLKDYGNFTEKRGKAMKRVKRITEKTVDGIKILVTSKALVEVNVDDYERGELDYVNSWDFKIPSKYNSAEDLVYAIARNSGIFSDKVEDYSFSDGSIQTDALVNNDNEEPSKAEIEAWKNGEETLYNAHLYLPVSCVMDEHEMTEDEAEEFGFEVY